MVVSIFASLQDNLKRNREQSQIFKFKQYNDMALVPQSTLKTRDALKHNVSYISEANWLR